MAALKQLSSEGFQGEEEEAQVRIMLHYAYNDHYYSSEGKKEDNEEDLKLFHDNGLWLIENFISDNLLKAEFYREIGEFEASHNVLKSVEVGDGFLKDILSSIQKRLELKDCKVFKIR